jgi:ribonuclease P protein component
MPSSHPNAFPRSRRLVWKRHFDAVFAKGLRTSTGTLVVRSRPNDLKHCRLGLAVSRRIGGAVVRNRVKRRLREAFRRLQIELDGEPISYDVVVTPRPHALLPTDAYMGQLARAITDLRTRWNKKRPNPPVA